MKKGEKIDHMTANKKKVRLKLHLFFNILTKFDSKQPRMNAQNFKFFKIGIPSSFKLAEILDR